MTERVAEPVLDIVAPAINHIVTEDDEPVDNLPSAKQQRLLVEPLYSNTWTEQAFLADANVGIFRSTKEPPVVPDMFLSFDVELAEDWWAKEHRTYLFGSLGNRLMWLSRLWRTKKVAKRAKNAMTMRV